jgi:NADH dehydrogenase
MGQRGDALHVVTGAFGYSGRHLARRLLDAGVRVRTLTGHTDRADPFAGRVEVRPLSFRDPAALAESLRGAAVLYNTYWVRFDHGETTHRRAVENTLALFEAAAAAGVERVVHVSITNPSLDSPLPYFRGKAELEGALASICPSYAVLRPTVLFGGRDVLLNNIAWILRRFPVFGVPGDGSYGIQPIHVEDLVTLAVEHGRSRDNVVLDAVGPETFSYVELVRLVRRAVGSRAPILPLPPALVLLAARALGLYVGDVVLTREEVDGLMAGLLVSDRPPTGVTRLTDWLPGQAEALGIAYANELARHFDRPGPGASPAPAAPAGARRARPS